MVLGRGVIAVPGSFSRAPGSWSYTPLVPPSPLLAYSSFHTTLSPFEFLAPLHFFCAFGSRRS